jgi:hypothetical protein
LTTERLLLWRLLLWRLLLWRLLLWRLLFCRDLHLDLQQSKQHNAALRSQFEVLHEI